eukprot:TRINITY_DN4203_c0_g1_i1.p1 TRINITY_DN4203_c0_g1~~TRINITY_DN4203_c0_g1_i1.p1  ORF type:complete len:339 (-),score=98.17 TRINITY_DN4203_c0_g1_i1:443-1423(-)
MVSSSSSSSRGTPFLSSLALLLLVVCVSCASAANPVEMAKAHVRERALTGAQEFFPTVSTCWYIPTEGPSLVLNPITNFTNGEVFSLNFQKTVVGSAGNMPMNLTGVNSSYAPVEVNATSLGLWLSIEYTMGDSFESFSVNIAKLGPDNSGLTFVTSTDTNVSITVVKTKTTNATLYLDIIFTTAPTHAEVSACFGQASSLPSPTTIVNQYTQLSAFNFSLVASEVSGNATVSPAPPSKIGFDDFYSIPNFTLTYQGADTFDGVLTYNATLPVNEGGVWSSVVWSTVEYVGVCFVNAVNGPLSFNTNVTSINEGDTAWNVFTTIDF